MEPEEKKPEEKMEIIALWGKGSGRGGYILVGGIRNCADDAEMNSIIRTFCGGWILPSVCASPSREKTTHSPAMQAKNGLFAK